VGPRRWVCRAMGINAFSDQRELTAERRAWQLRMLVVRRFQGFHLLRRTQVFLSMAFGQSQPGPSQILCQP